jgi:putative heme-binding domain-containing protein
MALRDLVVSSNATLAPNLPPSEWHVVLGADADARLRLTAAKGNLSENVWIAYSELAVASPSDVQFLAGANGPLKMWLNGQPLYERADSRNFIADEIRCDAKLSRGTNRLVVQIAAGKGQAEFHLRFRRKASTANHEALMQAALARPGNAENGRKLFLDIEKTQCLKCHRLGEQGEKIGPDLTGVGSRFARVYLVESILQPSRTIAPSYETLHVELADGRIVTGVRVAETADALILGDAKGNKQTIARTNIDSARPSPVSTMPEGLEQSMSADDFVDLIAFLASQKNPKKME